MSVLLNITMPKCSECCIANDDNWKCNVLDRIFDYDTMAEKRFDDCPLIEIPTPHGRLIDATFEENHYASMLLNPNPDVTREDKRKARIILDALHMVKTVIEAEGETE